MLNVNVRAKNAPHFQWMSGMVTTDGYQVTELWEIQETDLPDMRHPATLGCVLHRVREIYGEFAHVRYHSDRWLLEVKGAPAVVICDGNSYSEVLVKALEATFN